MLWVLPLMSINLLKPGQLLSLGLTGDIVPAQGGRGDKGRRGRRTPGHRWPSRQS